MNIMSGPVLKRALAMPRGRKETAERKHDKEIVLNTDLNIKRE